MWTNTQEITDLVTFTAEILMKNLIFCAFVVKFGWVFLTAQKWNYKLRISLVIVNKSAIFWWFGHINEKSSEAYLGPVKQIVNN